jgi:hypothetical protein
MRIPSVPALVSICLFGFGAALSAPPPTRNPAPVFDATGPVMGNPTDHPGQPTSPVAQPVDSVPSGRDAGAPAAAAPESGESHSGNTKRALIIAAAVIAVAAVIGLIVLGSSGSSGGGSY